ncbi:hypothetical protein BD410DRAFT_898375 [Rickenella mellea]|uniref:Uncharacterized protein n=1 Tax=Rickenella mellea TaxID=50990 RepID=A0A4Y7Q581_9AGAM|nr:hypothetical protein BD410DRAFT_898375 [Rickenella mellea]
MPLGVHSDDMVYPQVRKDGGIQITGLENLMRLLARVKKHGVQNANAHEVWDDVPRLAGRSIFSNHAKDSKDLSDLRCSLAEAKLCMTALNDVRDHLAKRIEILQDACIPMVLEDGIKTLPNEILSQIFEHGHDMWWDGKFGTCVSHVSRRFRQVSLMTPILWSTISSFFPDDPIQVFLSCSREKDLEISTLFDCDLSEKSFAKLLRPHLNRVVRLETDDAHALEHIGLTNFPHLRALHCEYPFYVNLSLWHVPLLSDIFAFNMVHGPLEFYSHLTCVDFGFIDGLDTSFLSFSQAASLMTSLRNLSITVSGCSGAVPDSEDIPRSRDFHTVHIETLMINISHSTPRNFVARLYDTLGILFPSTVLLQLTDLVDENPDFLRNSAGNIFPYGSMMNIRLSSVGDTRQSWEQSALLPTLVAACDVVHTLHIEAPMASLFGPRTMAGPVDIDWRLFTSLRHLQLLHCNELYVSDVKQLADNLIIGAEPEAGLQSLEILSCQNVSEYYLSGLGAKVGPEIKWKL